jgi:hypothetical protein
MVEHNFRPPADGAGFRVIPLPTALYVSEGLIFELYDGGQPCRSFSIRWERLVPAKEGEPEAASESRTCSHAHPKISPTQVQRSPTADFHPIANHEK